MSSTLASIHFSQTISDTIIKVAQIKGGKVEAEFPYLYGSILLGILLAPLMTWSFFLNRSRPYLIAQGVTVGFLIAGALGNFKHTILAWPLFCAFGVVLFLKRDYRFLCTPAGAVKALPFAFSMISATWLTSGVYDWGLLGYNKNFSLYAALHSMYLGWMLVGCFAFLAQKNGRKGQLYLMSCIFCFVAFLLIAFGIDGVPYIKPIGVIILAILAPLSMGLHTGSLGREQTGARLLGILSLIGLTGTMGLAITHEFWRGAFPYGLGVNPMVSVHGLINALIVIPGFFFSVFSSQHSDHGCS